MPRKARPKPQTCLTPDCENTKLRARGLCPSCYEKYRKGVASNKKLTWKKLENAGLAHSRKTAIGAAAKALETLSK